MSKSQGNHDADRTRKDLPPLAGDYVPGLDTDPSAIGRMRREIDALTEQNEKLREQIVEEKAKRR